MVSQTPRAAGDVDVDHDPTPLPPQLSPILRVPREVLLLFLDYLGFEDTLALSLTTRGLYYLTPSKAFPNRPLEACVSKMYRSFLPKPPTTPTDYGHCSYCFYPLCPPTCPTALILDSRTGIFYPPYLFPFRTATVAPTTGFSESPNCSSKHFIRSASPSNPKWDNTNIKLAHERPWKTVDDDKDPPGTDSTRTSYKTIWCDHHRCPPDLLDWNFHSKTPSMGAYRLYRDHSSKAWFRVRAGLQNPCLTQDPQFAPRFTDRTLQNISPEVLCPDNPQILPKHLGFFDKICNHCRLPVETRPWNDRICKCRPFYLPLNDNHEYIRISRASANLLRRCKCEPIGVKFIMCKGFEVGFRNGRSRKFDFGLAVLVDNFSKEEEEEEEGPEQEAHKKGLMMVKPAEVRRAIGMMAGEGYNTRLDGHENCDKCASKVEKDWEWEIDAGFWRRAQSRNQTVVVQRRASKKKYRRLCCVCDIS
ncbi:hypothetical protein TWF718_004134 [Orbilia javanica]|uniref:F-box domain-containing protein n=1 Tax=Orbilia javanica TaxID=47235 RepID=A0AAN8MXE4_9PEZI